MRILVIGINFHPEMTGVGKYTAEAAAYLSQNGEQVRVITTPPYYPYWQVQSGYRWWQYRHEEWQGIEVFRCPLWVPRTTSGIKRLLHLVSFAISSIPALIRQLQWRPDLVLCIAPSILTAPLAWLTARLCGSKAWLHIQDFELDAATTLGILTSGQRLQRLAAQIELWILTRFDRVSTISHQMMVRLQTKGVQTERACLIPNWVDTNQIFPLPDMQGGLRTALGIPEQALVVLYAGNFGTKQGLEQIVEAARRLQTHPPIFFVLCGEGAARASLEASARDLSNIRFIPLQPAEKLNQLLNVADIHLLPQRAGVADMVMPSKLLGMMASGRPVIATAEPDTEIGNVVSRIGLIVPPADTDALCEAILKLAGSPGERLRLGRQGRAFVCENWSADHVLPHFRSQLVKLFDQAVLQISVDTEPVKDTRNDPGASEGIHVLLN